MTRRRDLPKHTDLLAKTGDVEEFGIELAADLDTSPLQALAEPEIVEETAAILPVNYPR